MARRRIGDGRPVTGSDRPRLTGKCAAAHAAVCLSTSAALRRPCPSTVPLVGRFQALQVATAVPVRAHCGALPRSLTRMSGNTEATAGRLARLHRALAMQPAYQDRVCRSR